MTSCPSLRPTCLCLKPFRVVPLLPTSSARMCGSFSKAQWIYYLIAEGGVAFFFFNCRVLLEIGLFTALCIPGCNHEPHGTRVSLSRIFRDKPHTIADSAWDTQTCVASRVTHRHFQCVSSLFPRITLWGWSCAHFLDVGIGGIFLLPEDAKVWDGI